MAEHQNLPDSCGKQVKVAAVQTNPVLLGKEQNLAAMLKHIDTVADSGARLVVFPECALAGYVFADKSETTEVAETIPGPSTDVLAHKARERQVYLVVGMVESYGMSFYNSAVLIGPEGVIGKYRKMHPWYPAEASWPVTPGEASQGYPVFETEIGKIGIIICFDMWITESARMLALNGADIIAFPTNTVDVPAGLACVDHILRTRALENHVWIVGADRIGTERDVPFAGRSQILDLYGNVMVEASTDKEEIIYADLEIGLATRDKMMVPDLPAADIWWSRRPESYAKISSGE